jgi:SAM-dependent methyltransferase
MLDVGAAAGFLLKGFLDQGWHGEGIEPNPRMAEHARQHLGLDVMTGTLEQFESDRQYDLVSMIQVIAHFVDPQRALRVAAERTRNGGYWLIETWNRESWTARAFGQQWHEYSPPSVLHWFSPEGLGRLAAQFDFREIARGRPSKWIGGGHARSLLRYRLEGSRVGRFFAGAVGLIPERLALPYPAEDLFWTLYQKSS